MTQTDGFLTLQNEYMRIEICDPAADDAHFSSRYSHAGYISQIYAPGGEGLLGMPTEDFRPLSGEGFPDEFEMPVGYDEAAVGGEFLKIGAGRERRRSKAPYTNRDGHEIVRRAEISVSREKGALIDASYGRRTQAVLIMDSDHVILSGIPLDSVTGRFAQEEKEE